MTAGRRALEESKTIEGTATEGDESASDRSITSGRDQGET